jgi:hypothetical protein
MQDQCRSVPAPAAAETLINAAVRPALDGLWWTAWHASHDGDPELAAHLLAAHERLREAAYPERRAA